MALTEENVVPLTEEKDFTVTYWTGSTRTFQCKTIDEAASLAGYNAETEVTHGIHIWRFTDGSLEVTNSDGDIVAQIREAA